MTTHDRDPHNDGRTVEIIYVDRVDRDQDHPHGPFHWDGQRWRTTVRVETAQTTHITLHGRSTDQWYRRDLRGPFDLGPPRYRWHHTDGGAAPDHIVRALDQALLAPHPEKGHSHG
jgi:hypothetical protein